MIMVSQPVYAVVEMNNGSVMQPTRTILADKFALEKAARLERWKLTDDAMPITSEVFIAYAVAKRTGFIPLDMDWPTFIDQCCDARLTHDGPEVDPTQPGMGPEPSAGS